MTYFMEVGILEMIICRGAWVALLVRWPTLDFSLDHDLRVRESSPTSGSLFSGNLLEDSFSLSLYPPSLVHTLSKINR